MQSVNTQALEHAYQKKVELLLEDRNCYKIMIVKTKLLFFKVKNPFFPFKYKNSGNFTIELLDTEEIQEDTNENELGKLSYHRNQVTYTSIDPSRNYDGNELLKMH